MLINTLTLVLVMASLVAQKPFSETYRPGHWQPVIRVSTKSSLSLVLTNKTPTEINYSFLDGRAAERRIAPGDRVQINKVTLPLDLTVFNPVRTAIVDTGIKYDFVFDPALNQIQITVAPAKNSDSTTINIDSNGGVYLY